MTLTVSTNVVFADKKIKRLAVRVGHRNGVTVTIDGPGIHQTKKTSRGGWAVFRFTPLKKGIIRVSAPGACNFAQVGVTPKRVPPIGG